MEYYPISWKQLHTSAFALAQQIKSKEKNLDVIVAIARGGVTIAHMLSDFLTLPLTTFTLTSYHGLQQTSSLKVLYNLADMLNGKNVLLVDDVSDTGKTFVYSLEYLAKYRTKRIITASLFIKPQTIFLPDYYQKKTDKWIIFPQDVRETIDSIGSAMQKTGQTKEQIKAQLIEIGIPKQFVNKLT